mmetsp:Transcript_105741/g.340940  ORF Transcript_105741/g.340940 Transcript_105741/m.340940 type:complete len:207 (-) Transcript_105741:149-769(-)
MGLRVALLACLRSPRCSDLCCAKISGWPRSGRPSPGSFGLGPPLAEVPPPSPWPRRLRMPGRVARRASELSPARPKKILAGGMETDQEPVGAWPGRGCSSSKVLLGRDEVVALLRELLAGFTSDSFQWKLALLKEAQRHEPGSGHCLDGCEELALAIQRRVLPRYGFEGSRRGALSMSRECSRYLRDAEVLSLHSAIAQELSAAVR